MANLRCCTSMAPAGCLHAAASAACVICALSCRCIPFPDDLVHAHLGASSCVHTAPDYDSSCSDPVSHVARVSLPTMQRALYGSWCTCSGRWTGSSRPSLIRTSRAPLSRPMAYVGRCRTPPNSGSVSACSHRNTSSIAAPADPRDTATGHQYHQPAYLR